MDIQNDRQLNILEYVLLFLGFMNVTGRGTYVLLAFTGLYILLRTRTIFGSSLRITVHLS